MNTLINVFFFHVLSFDHLLLWEVIAQVKLKQIHIFVNQDKLEEFHAHVKFVICKVLGSPLDNADEIKKNKIAGKCSIQH